MKTEEIVVPERNYKMYTCEGCGQKSKSAIYMQAHEKTCKKQKECGHEKYWYGLEIGSETGWGDVLMLEKKCKDCRAVFPLEVEIEDIDEDQIAEIWRILEDGN